MKQPNIAVYAFLLIFVTLFSSCGLFSYPYIFPPTVTSSLTGSSGPITVRNNDENDADIFQGYEIYYKFYDKASSTTAMPNDHKALFEKEEPEPSDITKLGFRKVETTKFYTINRIVQKTPTPMILVDYSSRTDSFTFVIDFRGVDAGINQEVIPSVTSASGGDLDNEGVELYRPIIDTEHDEYGSNNQPRKSFRLEDLSSSDSDMRNISEATLSLYIFAYGKYDRVNNIYSKPVLLGFIDYREITD